jgi:hypothetical protein
MINKANACASSSASASYEENRNLSGRIESHFSQRFNAKIDENYELAIEFESTQRTQSTEKLIQNNQIFNIADFSRLVMRLKSICCSIPNLGDKLMLFISMVLKGTMAIQNALWILKEWH